MDVVSVTPSKSVYLGHRDKDRPEFGIIIDEKNDAGLWCSSLYTDKEMRQSYVCEEWKTTEWDMFENIYFSNDLKKCKDINQYFDLAVFEFDSEKAKLCKQKRFGFYVNNNNKGDENEGVVVRVYSRQEKQFVLSWVTYEKYDTVWRYYDQDCAFCIDENSQSVDDRMTSAEGVFKDSSNKDICSYIIMVTRVKKNKEEKIFAYSNDSADNWPDDDDDNWTCDCGRRDTPHKHTSTRDGVDETDGGEHYTSTRDGVDDDDETDGGGHHHDSIFGVADSATQSSKKNYQYANVKRGGKTNVTFKDTKPIYEGAPINFYHVTIVTRNCTKPIKQ